MPFSETARNFRLEGSRFFAEVQRADGSWVESEIDLNDHVGNNDGEVDLNGTGIHNSADPASWRLDYITIITLLYRVDGSFGSEQFLNLDHHLANEDGRIVFNK